jgi:hypothetical protein
MPIQHGTTSIARRERKVLLVVHDLIYFEAYRRLAPSQLAVSVTRQGIPKSGHATGPPRGMPNRHRFTTLQSTRLIQTLSVFRRSRLALYQMLCRTNCSLHPPSLADRNAAIYLAVTGDAPSKNLAALLEAFRIAVDELPREVLPLGRWSSEGNVNGLGSKE